jgi:hypothetical protein
LCFVFCGTETSKQAEPKAPGISSRVSIALEEGFGAGKVIARQPQLDRMGRKCWKSGDKVNNDDKKRYQKTGLQNFNGLQIQKNPFCAF